MNPLAAAFGRLCVETGVLLHPNFGIKAAASARLCVETPHRSGLHNPSGCSRLRAAVC